MCPSLHWVQDSNPKPMDPPSHPRYHRHQTLSDPCHHHLRRYPHSPNRPLRSSSASVWPFQRDHSPVSTSSLLTLSSCSSRLDCPLTERQKTACRRCHSRSPQPQLHRPRHHRSNPNHQVQTSTPIPYYHPNQKAM